MAAQARGLEKLTFSLNGKRVTVATHPMKRLLDVLREECGFTGTKEGCGEGECGACTVLMNGVSVNACLVPAIHADGAKLMSVEGLARGRVLGPLQTAFIEFGGAQCGICTPGMLLSAHELLARTPGRVPSDAEVRDALAGNLCRCTGYQKIVDAVRAAARRSLTSSSDRDSGRKKPAKKTASGNATKKAGKRTATRTAAAARNRGGGKAARRKAAPKKKSAGTKKNSSPRRHR
jgi:carbon-monoxide dehydrogenase small subunit